MNIRGLIVSLHKVFCYSMSHKLLNNGTKIADTYQHYFVLWSYFVVRRVN